MRFLVQRKPFLVSKMQLSVSMDPARPGLPSRVPSLPAAHSFRAAMNGMLESLERPLPSPRPAVTPTTPRFTTESLFPNIPFLFEVEFVEKAGSLPRID